MANQTAFKWVIKEAKRLRREYPKRFKKWQDYVKEAWAVWYSKHGEKKTRVIGKTKKPVHKKQSTVKHTYRKKEYRIERKRRTPASKVRHGLSMAKKALLEEIARLEAKKFTARLKRDKTKIQKEISAKKRLYKKLM